jgi:hypothetical protein
MLQAALMVKMGKSFDAIAALHPQSEIVFRQKMELPLSLGRNGP